MSEHVNLVCFKEVNSLKYTSQCSLTQELNTLNCVMSRSLTDYFSPRDVLTLQLCCPSKSIIFKHKKSSFESIN